MQVEGTACTHGSQPRPAMSVKTRPIAAGFHEQSYHEATSLGLRNTKIVGARPTSDKMEICNSMGWRKVYNIWRSTQQRGRSGVSHRLNSQEQASWRSSRLRRVQVQVWCHNLVITKTTDMMLDSSQVLVHQPVHLAHRSRSGCIYTPAGKMTCKQ